MLYLYLFGAEKEGIISLGSRVFFGQQNQKVSIGYFKLCDISKHIWWVLPLCLILFKGNILILTNIEMAIT